MKLSKGKIVVLAICLLCLIISIGGIVVYIQDEQEIRELLTDTNSDTKEINDVKSVYSDTHLRVEGTEIDYDIVQGEDNEYYLTHTPEGKYNKAGWLFFDYRVTEESQNKIIYGHNRVTGVMFGSLVNLTTKRYYKENGRDVIHITQNGVEETYKVFSVYITDINFDYLYCDFADTASYKAYITKVKAKNTIETFEDIVITEDDKILTLSTCAGKTDRLVVHAVKVKNGGI